MEIFEWAGSVQKDVLIQKNSRVQHSSDINADCIVTDAFQVNNQ